MGSSSAVIASFSIHAWSATVWLPNEGAVSSSTVTVKLSAAVSPSPSVTVQTKVRPALSREGVPEIVRLGASNESPAGSVPLKV